VEAKNTNLRVREEEGVNYAKEKRLFREKECKPREMHSGHVLPRGTLQNNKHPRDQKARESKQKREATARVLVGISIKGNNTKFKASKKLEATKKQPKVIILRVGRYPLSCMPTLDKNLTKKRTKDMG